MSNRTMSMIHEENKGALLFFCKINSSHYEYGDLNLLLPVRDKATRNVPKIRRIVVDAPDVRKSGIISIRATDTSTISFSYCKSPLRFCKSPLEILHPPLSTSLFNFFFSPVSKRREVACSKGCSRVSRGNSTHGSSLSLSIFKTQKRLRCLSVDITFRIKDRIGQCPA